MNDYLVTSKGGFIYGSLKFEKASMTAEELAVLLAYLLHDEVIEGTLNVPGRGVLGIRQKIVGQETT